MTPEAMKFWLDMFHSPVALTLAGALLGAVSTLAGVAQVATRCQRK